ncbi:glycosyltransferase [Furfurilactobacillus curtus]
MNYFLTNMLDYNLSGIEQAQMERLHLFDRHHQPSKIIVRRYNRFLQLNATRAGLKDGDFVGMYDFFQQAMSANVKPAKIKDLKLNQLEGPIHEANKYTFFQAGRIAVEVILFPDSNDYQRDQIDTVRYFKRNGQLAQADYYDVRGFKSMSDLYGRDGGVAREIMYDPKGHERIASVYQALPNGNIEATGFQVNDQDGRHLFDDEPAMFAYFLDRLNLLDDGNRFIDDRPNLIDDGLFQMKTSATVYCYWHNVFSPNYLQQQPTDVYQTLQNQIDHQAKIAGWLTPTATEAAALAKVLPDDAKVDVVPSIVLENLPAEVASISKRPMRLVAATRIDAQKQLDQMIAAFAQIVREHPQAHLDIFGDISDRNVQRELDDSVRRLRLQRAVTFRSFTAKKQDMFESAQLYLLTSAYEGFNRGMVEAASFGVPTVGYDLNYGPRDFIDPENSGLLTPINNVNEFAKQTSQLLTDSDRLIVMSHLARQRAQQYDAESIWRAYTAAGVVDRKEG